MYRFKVTRFEATRVSQMHLFYFFIIIFTTASIYRSLRNIFHNDTILTSASRMETIASIIIMAVRSYTNNIGITTTYYVESTRELTNTRKTSHKHNSKNLSCLR